MRAMPYISNLVTALLRMRLKRSLPTTLFSDEQKKGHYAVFGPTFEGRHLTIVFELKPKGIARPFTGWDMRRAEIQYYKKHRR